MRRNLRISGAQLSAALASAKPKGRARINRASREDRTYNGVVFDSASEARYAQACDLQGLAYERQKPFPLITADGVVVRMLRVDFWHPTLALAVEIKAGKRDKNGHLHGWWSEASKLAWRWFRACHPSIAVKVLAWEQGEFKEVRVK